MTEESGKMPHRKLSIEFKNFMEKVNSRIKRTSKIYKDCKACGKKQNDTQFPKGRNPFFVDGRISICRACLEDMVDYDNPLEVQYALSLLFLPYIEDVWQKILSKGASNPFGVYLSKLNLVQYKDYEPAIIHRLKTQMEKFDEDPYQSRLDIMTEDEAQFLRIQWGEVWDLKDSLKMQDYYERMKREFNINNASHDDTLRKIIKTSLTADKALEKGSIGDFQKLTKTFNDMMKQAEFSAASKKDKRDDGTLNAVGVLYALAEKQKFIPRYHNEEDPDVVDKTEKNIMSYTKRLITNEADLNILLENAAKRVLEQEKKEEAQQQEYLKIEDLEDGL